MLKLLVQAKGADALTRKFQKYVKQAPDKMEKTMWKSLFLAQRSAKKSLSGETLKVRTNRLRSSVIAKIIKRWPNMEGAVGTNAFYGSIHEFGKVIRAKSSVGMLFKIKDRWIRKHEVIIPARPWLNPALEKNRQKIREMFDKDVGSAIKEAEL